MPDIKIRAATDADVPAIAAVVLAAAAAEAPWTSFLPARARQDPVLVQHAEAVARRSVESASVVVMVAERSNRSTPPEIVAVSVWDTQPAAAVVAVKADSESYTTDDDIDDDGDDGWTPSDAARYPKLALLGDAMRRGRRRYFAAEGPHVYLRVLATHPKHQHQGYAKALCRWGVGLAHRRRAAVCLATGARGYIVLSGMGFRDLGAVVVPAGKGYEEQVLKALRMDAAAVQATNPGVWDSLWKYIST